VLPIGLALSPHVVRRAVLVRRIHATPTWLRPEASRRLRRDLAAQQAGEGLTWKGRIRSRRSFRYHAVATASLELLARDVDVLVVHPFLDVRFAAELAALPRQQRYPNRTTAMRTLFGDLLPDDVLTRDTKASFDSVFWTEHSREFVRTWDGGGVDASLVDVDALRQVWSSSEPDPRSFTLAQSAWLAASGGKAGDETVDRARRGRPVSGPPERPRG
jgi:asparagine synthase (glutamine-hydrolysing)